MADKLNAAAVAAGLSAEERKQMEALSKTLAIHRELSNLPQKTAQQAYASKTPEQQDALKRVAGTEDPATKPQRGFLGTAWHYTGGALLQGLQEVSDLTTRAYRTGAIAVQENKNLADAWVTANDKGDKVFNPGRIEKAKSKFGTDRVNVAMRVAAGEKLSESTVLRMYSFFRRHEVDKQAQGFRPGEDGYPSAGRVAWAAWGGDAGYRWATAARKEILKKMAPKENGKSYHPYYGYELTDADA